MTDRDRLIELLDATFEKQYKNLVITAPHTADYLIANGVTVNEWISVEDRLPEPMEWMLCFCSTNVVHILRLDDYGHYWTTQSLCKHYKKEYVTHWMPLPQPPKEVE